MRDKKNYDKEQETVEKGIKRNMTKKQEKNIRNKISKQRKKIS